MKKSLVLGSLVVAMGLFTGCGTTINMGDYPNKIRQNVNVPEACQAEYNILKDVPSVAIMRFTNNTNYGIAQTTNKDTEANYKKNSSAGLAITKNGVGVASSTEAHLDTHSNTTKRTVDPKIDKAITSALEGTLAELGGADVYSREDLAKIMKEQKFQQSGLADENTLVQVGKLAGVKYILTGSIDSVTQKYVDLEDKNKNQNQNQGGGIAGLLVNAAIDAGKSAMSGMKITTKVTFKVISVETGKIIFSANTEGTKNIGKIPHPNYEQIVGGIKDGMLDAVKNARPEMSKFFSVNGYITQIKTDKERKKYIAQINLGTKNKVKPEQEFVVYSFDEIEDPISHKTSCDKSTLNVTLKVSKNQIQPNRAWTEVDGDDATLLRAGQIVKRKALENSLF